MKLQIIKQSGKPVDPIAARQFDEEWRLMFDKAELKSSNIFQKRTGKLTRTPHMLILQRMLNFTEYVLTKKYNQDQFVTLPTSARQWTKLIEHYGNYPILTAKRADKKELILLIMDESNG